MRVAAVTVAKTSMRLPRQSFAVMICSKAFGCALFMGVLLTATANAQPLQPTPSPAATPPSNAAPAPEPSAAPTAEAIPQASTHPGGIVPKADKLLTRACEALASASAFSFHAEILFDEVLPPDVKVQFAGAMDYAVQRPDELAIEFHSDLGAKRLWYSGRNLTILDLPHMVYSSVAVPSTIDGMLTKIAADHNVTIPLGDFAASDPCLLIHQQATYGGYIGINDVNGVDCDHIALSSPKADFQLWLDRSGKPVPRKVVINYRTDPGSPEYIAVLSNWKFPNKISANHFRASLPRQAKRIEILKVAEPTP
jgi:hypothetical protein